ncbi:MAG: SDR family oxidoreductase [Candidatus Hydrogenedentes bacterium]|nr:SDR family oxidoreductase [Candidatus Hydrogenedentota bacterium]
MSARVLNLLWVGGGVPNSLEWAVDSHIVACAPDSVAMASALDTLGKGLLLCVIVLDGNRERCKKLLRYLHEARPMMPIGVLISREEHPDALALLNERVIDRIIPRTTMETALREHITALATHGELLTDLHGRLHGLNGANLFVTGGTGFLGQHFLRYVLRCSGARVDVLTRSRAGEPFDQRLADLQGAFPGRIHCVEGDIREPGLGLSAEDAEALRQRVDTIWHLAAITKFEPILRDVIVQTNLEGTRHVVAFAHTVKNLSCFHHVSTAYVAGNQDDTGSLPETAIPEPASFKNPYEESKYHAEQWVVASGLPVVVYRPSIIMGERVSGLSDGQTIYNVAKMLRLARLTGKRRASRNPDTAESTSFRVVVAPSAAKNLMPVDEILSRMLRIAATNPASGSFFNLTHAQPTTMTDIIAVIASLLDISEYEAVDTLDGEVLSAAESILQRISSVFKPYMLKSDPTFESAGASRQAGLNHPHAVDRAQLRFFLQSFFEQHFGLDFESSPVSR